MNAAIVVAAGRGSRFKAAENKLYVDLLGKPLLAYSLEALEATAVVDEVILVVAADCVDYCRHDIVERYKLKKVKELVAGGRRRQDSVLAGLQALSAADKVMIHDGARPLIKPGQIEAVINACDNRTAAVLAVPVVDTLKEVGKDYLIKRTLSRRHVYRSQTPQSFKYDKLRKAYERARREGLAVTDDAAAWEAVGLACRVVIGDEENIKVTTAADLKIVKAILKERLT